MGKRRLLGMDLIRPKEENGLTATDKNKKIKSLTKKKVTGSKSNPPPDPDGPRVGNYLPAKATDEEAERYQRMQEEGTKKKPEEKS